MLTSSRIYTSNLHADIILSMTLCGINSSANYVRTSDIDAARRFPIYALTALSGPRELLFARSAYDCRGTILSYVHGGHNTSNRDSPQPNTILYLQRQLLEPAMRVKEFTACCSSDSSNGVRQISLLTEGGLLMSIGEPCDTSSAPQRWLTVPDGYTFAGLVTDSTTNSSNNWVHRVAMIAIRECTITHSVTLDMEKNWTH